MAENQDQYAPSPAIESVQESAVSSSRQAAMDAVLAQMESGVSDEMLGDDYADAKSADEESTDEVPEDEDIEDTEAADSEDEEDEEDDSDDSEDTEDTDEDDDVVEDEDPKLAKKLAALQRAEARGKDALAKERQAFDAERQTWETARDAQAKQVEAYELARKRAQYDPGALLHELGITSPDDLVAAARQLYALSKGDDADPQQRAAAQRTLRDREHSDELAAMRKELADIKAAREQEKASAAEERRTEQYLKSITDAVGDGSPLVSIMIEKNPAGTRERLFNIAKYLAQQTQEAPDPEDVIEALEQARRDELEELGIDPSTVLPTKKKTQNGMKQRKAKTLSSDLGNPKSPQKQKAKSREQEIADVRRSLESGQLE